MNWHWRDIVMVLCAWVLPIGMFAYGVERIESSKCESIEQTLDVLRRVVLETDAPAVDGDGPAVAEMPEFAALDPETRAFVIALFTQSPGDDDEPTFAERVLPMIPVLEC